MNVLSTVAAFTLVVAAAITVGLLWKDTTKPAVAQAPAITRMTEVQVVLEPRDGFSTDKVLNTVTTFYIVHPDGTKQKVSAAAYHAAGPTK